MKPRLALALVHHPCVDRNGEVFTTSLTNLDLHDCARSSRTYELDAFYIVTPIKAQQELAQTIAHFWDGEAGKKRNPSRADAMQRVHVVADIAAAVASERQASGVAPFVLATSAQAGDEALTFPQGRERVQTEPNTLLLFGTGHGLAPSALEGASAVLTKVPGCGDYNHLSVRSAVAIILDRLFAPDRNGF